jgi:hypothetical protein
MKIPFAGSTCPYCHQNKAKDQMYTTLALGLGLVLGYAGHTVLGGWGAVGGVFVGCALAFVVSGRSWSSPPVQSEGQEPLAPHAGSASAEERLLQLKEMRDKGLIDEDEYAERKKSLLDGMLR